MEFEAAAAWDRPFAEAVAWFQSKRLVSREEFRALSREMQARAFTAAWVYAAEELQTVYEACLAALEGGGTLADFVRQTEEILGRPWHRETVFRTNVLSAYGRGHWEQAQAVRELRPYGRYSAVMDGRTRPSHAALHGLVYPLDHPFWRYYWPPWDYNCRCGVITLSGEEVKQQGLKVEEEIPRGLKPEKFTSPAAGGWEADWDKYLAHVRQQGLTELIRSYNPEQFPGVDWSQYLAILKRQVGQEHLDLLETVLWEQEVGGVAGFPAWAARTLERNRVIGEMYPIGNIPGAKLGALQDRFGVQPKMSLVVTDDKAILHMLAKAKPESALTPAEIFSLPERLKKAEWYFDQEDPALLMTWIRAGDRWIKVVIRMDQKIGKGIANRIVTTGVVEEQDIERPKRYAKL
jgi:SPP1 gp7 family putative phage head morphogenesis protein